MKKIIALLLVAIMMFAFAGCSENKNKEDSVLKIGIIQYMSHPSLDNCYNGIISALENSGIEYTVDYQTGSSSSADTDCTNFAKKS